LPFWCGWKRYAYNPARRGWFHKYLWGGAARTTKTDRVERNLGIAPVAFGRPHEPLIGAPRAALHGMVGTRGGPDWITGRLGSIIIDIIPICHPFPDVAGHVQRAGGERIQPGALPRKPPITDKTFRCCSGRWRVGNGCGLSAQLSLILILVCPGKALERCSPVDKRKVTCKFRPLIRY
jgi:hypothetical protein